MAARKRRIKHTLSKFKNIVRKKKTPSTQFRGRDAKTGQFVSGFKAEKVGKFTTILTRPVSPNVLQAMKSLANRG
jgi:hypothetical protein